MHLVAPPSAHCSTIDPERQHSRRLAHTTRAFEQAGVAGLLIEDQTWPKRCGHMSGKDVIPAEEMVEKIHAACAARHDPAFVVTARTDAFATHGLPEVLRRLTLYADAGADLLFAAA
ncbi:MAG TPA: isocitrate lyase/PEP mutase family protein [Candidatus Saccharimonadia bacterium]|nr:isocitrate lyase/PEP mutase family protein [Candidatus Saccharimonadia bacterium]